MSGALVGKVAIVTGAASGIGRACALELARRGASLSVADLNREGADAVAREIHAAGGRALAVEVDVSDEAGVVQMIAATVEAFGRLDVLHNNAALTERSFLERDTDVEHMDIEVWERTLAVDLRSQMLGCKHAIPQMKKAGGGSIINTSSGSGLRGDAIRMAYGVAKAGTIALSQYVAAAYGPYKIRCNAIVPGLILNPQRPLSIPEPVQDFLVSCIPLSRAGSGLDIARVVAFLASDDAAFVTAQAISVDGGMQQMQPMYPMTRKMMKP